MVRSALVLACALALAACGGSAPEPTVSGLRLARQGSGYPTLTGYVVNRGDAAIRSADVSVTLYDPDNRPMEDVMVQVRRVEAGDSARFEKRLDVDARGAKLKYVGAN